MHDYTKQLQNPSSKFAKLFRRKGAKVLEENGKIKYTHLACQVGKDLTSKMRVHKKDYLGKRQSFG